MNDITDYVKRCAELEVALQAVKSQCGKNALSHMAEYHRAERYKAALAKLASLCGVLQGCQTVATLTWNDAVREAQEALKE